MAFHSYAAGERPTASQWNDWIGRRVVADCTASTRPATPVEGQPIYETDTDRILVYDGAAWQQVGQVGAWSTYAPTWTTSGTAPSIGNGSLLGRYQILSGRTMFVQFTFVAGSTTTFGTGTWSFSLPASKLAVNSGFQVGAGFCRPASTYWPLIIEATNAGTIVPLPPTSSGDCRLSATGVTATAPASWTSGDSLWLSVTVETSA